MLPSDLLFSRRRGSDVAPRFVERRHDPWAEAVLETIAGHLRRPRGELAAALRALEGDSPDYRLIRGFAHLALAEATFEPALGEPAPEQLRHEAFLLAASEDLGVGADGGGQAGFGRGYSERRSAVVIAELAGRYDIAPDAFEDALYADLPERHLLTALPAYTPETLVDRYNLAQAQGLLYSALYLRVTAYRNVPGEYRRLFHRLKFHGLMYAIEGNLEDGYQIYIDGPASVFRQTRKYGIRMAIFLPALLDISRWRLQAVLQQQGRELNYRLDDGSPLRANRPKPPAYDSLLEQGFAERWSRLDTPWTLEREVEIVDLKGTVFCPDFALRHPDGRVVHVEIVGFWHPDYLRRKLDKVRRAAMDNLVLAVSDRLNVGDGDVAGLAGPVVFFKGKLEPGRILPLLDAWPGQRRS